MEDWEVFDIQVALKIIRHISAGIYRTPGGILKELVNNSYDAGATTVQIKSGHPEYTSISIKDDGDGMTKESLEFSFMHIGASQKALEEDYPSSFGRKIIGMFGIGMLAAVHASPHIKLKTFPKDEAYGIEAIFDLSPYFEYVNQIKTLEEFKFGTIRYKQIERGNNDKGTEIILEGISKDSSFYKAISRKDKKIRGFVEWPKDPSSTEDNGKIMSLFTHNIDQNGVRSVEDLNGREQFLWELGLICPVEYLDEGPIKDEFLNEESKQIIGDIKNELSSLRFKVFFDGVQLRKPIILPSTKIRTSELDELDQDANKDVKVYLIKVNDTIPESESQNKVVALGYIVHQPHRVVPIQLMGLYPRVKYVGVGRYDNNFFRVIHGEQPILRAQLSGEVYIKEGLDDAMNLDREGFSEIDIGYQVLRDKLKRIIEEDHNSVVKEAKKTSNIRRKRRLEIKEQKPKINIKEEVSQTLKNLIPNKEINLVFSDNRMSDKEVREYSSLGIRSSESKIELIITDLRINDPKTISLIVKVDALLSSRPELIELREEVRKIVNMLFKDE